ncbi:hypothetical protein [Streptomyces sp. A30]|uniref:hypothetical protein n=1 Tax=Streptomyces sp. A30 TaxID=2789273 RepID=UPI00397F37EA
MATLLRTVFEQPDTIAVQAQMRHVLDALEAKFPKAAAHLVPSDVERTMSGADRTVALPRQFTVRRGDDPA